MNKKYVPQKAPNLICRHLDDGTVIIDPDKGDVRVLNELGSVIWDLIDGERTIENIRDEILLLYESDDEKQITDDLQFYFTSLSDRGLVLWAQT